MLNSSTKFVNQKSEMNAIVTGASSGIGYELVKNLVSNPRVEKVLALARRTDRLKVLANECDSKKLFIETFDLQHGDFVELKTCSFFNNTDRIDLLVNNAGLLVNAPFEELNIKDFQSSYEVNVFGPVKMIHAVLSLLRNSESAHVVNISSMGGFQGASKFAGLSAYSSSKGALSCLSECLAEEFKEDGIKVNCLALGAVQTEMLESAFPGYQAPITPSQMGSYIAEFGMNGHIVYNGKVLPVSLSTP